MRIVRAVFAYGRMNPPTAGHRRVVESLRKEAEATGAVLRLYVSETHDPKRNPLDLQSKLALVRRSFPNVEVRSAKNVFAAGLELAAEGVDDLVMVVGEDRLDSFTKTLTAYVGTEHLPVKTLEVRAISRTEEDVSATQARDAAQRGDWQSFAALSPTEDETVTTDLYKAVRIGMLCDGLY